jgi:hypothetical protein
MHSVYYNKHKENIENTFFHYLVLAGQAKHFDRYYIKFLLVKIRLEFSGHYKYSKFSGSKMKIFYQPSALSDAFLF